MTKYSNTILSLTLLLFSLVLCFFVGEIAVRALGLVKDDERALLFSSPTFRQDDNGAVRYYENEKIRTLAVYGDKIDYDVEFSTNNMGFVDPMNYKETSYKPRQIALIGDSFTAGFHGGSPWVPRLREARELAEADIYNLGVSGTGFEHFARLLNSVRDELPITEIVVLAISDDFKRRFWYPSIHNSNIYFCKEESTSQDCNHGLYIAKIVAQESTQDEVLNFATSVVIDRNIFNNGGDGWFKRLAKKSKLLRFLMANVKASTSDQSQELEKSIQYSLTALKKIKKSFPEVDVKFIHLPQKEEVATGKYLLDGIQEKVEKIGVSYTPILFDGTWSLEMYHEEDSHPNRLGYDKIYDCVLKIVADDRR